MVVGASTRGAYDMKVSGAGSKGVSSKRGGWSISQGFRVEQFSLPLMHATGPAGKEFRNNIVWRSFDSGRGARPMEGEKTQPKPDLIVHTKATRALTRALHV